MAQSVFSKVFDAVPGVVNNFIKPVLPLSVGLPQSIAATKPAQYLVQIFNSSPGTPDITAFLQEKFVFNVSSSWSDTPQMSGLFADINDAWQLATGDSIQFTMATRRKWRGSSPISLEIKLKFEAFEDVRNEVILPCVVLQGLALPSGGTQIIKGLGAGQFFLTPPGPNPYYIASLQGVTVGKHAPFEAGESTKIVIGNFVTFNQVIISSVDVTFESRMGRDGPIGAEVLVHFQTYEMLTRERLNTAYGGVAGKEFKVGGITDNGQVVSKIPA